MNYYAISALINALTALVICAFVLYKTRMKSPVALPFSAMALAIGFWSINYLLWQLSTGYDSALFYARGLLLGATWIPVTFLHFTIHLVQRTKRYNAIIKFAYIFAIGLSGAHFTPLVTKLVEPTAGFPFWPKPGILFHVFLTFFILATASAHLLIWNEIKACTDKKKSLQIKYVFLGALVGFIGGSTNFFLYYDIPIKPYGNILVSIYVATVAYAIVKHQLLDIRIIIKKTLFYSILTMLITIFYFAIVYIIHALYRSENVLVGLWWADFLFIIVIALTFKPLELLINQFLQKRIFKGTIGEISEQKEKLQLELERRQRLKSVGILAAGMVHEIRNPLTSLRTFAEYLPSKYQDPDFREKFSRIAIQETDRIKKIADNLLLFAKPAEPDKRKCDVSVIIQEITDLLSSDLLKRNVDFQFEPNVCFVNVDPEQAKQALLNVMMNAIESMDGQGGTLQVQINTHGNYGTISIKDNGCGIDSDKIPFLFDPFYTDKDGGTGLGLPITHSLIERNRGRIEIFSVKGQGSEFRIYLPRAS